MLSLIITIILCGIQPLYSDHGVCELCGDNTDCYTNDNLPDEACIDIGGQNRCYWANFTHPDVVEDRNCTSDYYCMDELDNEDENSCLRCCDDSEFGSFCTETISTGGEGCGDYRFGPLTAPCCPGTVCVDPIFGICGVGAGECEECKVTRVTSFGETEDETITGDNCGEGLFCMVDTNSVVIYEQFEVSYGICVPANGISLTVTTCDGDEECPSCMRCCEGECIRSSGDICGLQFAGRGPCCCPEDVCKLNECVVTHTSDDGDDDDDDDDDINSSGDNAAVRRVLLGAQENEEMLGLTDDNQNDTRMWNLYVFMIVVAFILVAFI